MRRQIVIMLLGLMTTLSLPAFAIAGSREISHATQPYKYIGKELDRTHGLDWYDHGAHHYDPVTGRWNTMDKMCEKYYGISPYASCGEDPVNAFDPDGMDWYRDRDKTWLFDPNVHSGKDRFIKGSRSPLEKVTTW